MFNAGKTYKSLLQIKSHILQPYMLIVTMNTDRPKQTLTMTRDLP